MRRLLTALVALQFVLVASGCSHTVVIDTEPSGGQVKVNGENLGNGPVTYTETTGWEKVYEVEASKPGFKNTRRTLKQTEYNMPVLAGSIGGFLLCGWTGIGLASLAGILFSRQLPDRVTIPLEKGGSGGGTSSAPVEDYGY